MDEKKRAKREKRFEILSKENVSPMREATVLRDRETGVHYLSLVNGYAGGLTVLVDKDGKPIVS